MNDATPASPDGSTGERKRRRARGGGLLAGAVLAAAAGALLGLMARPAPGRQAALAREALAVARAVEAHRLAPALYRRAEMAYLAGGQAVARAGEQWFPRYGRARASYREAAMLAEDAVAAADERDPGRDRATIEETLPVLRQVLAGVRGDVDLLSTRWERAVGRGDLPRWYRRQLDAVEERIGDIETSLAAEDLLEAAARATATGSQLRTLRQDLVAWRLSLELHEE